jgi:hypothetical protein
MLLRVPEISAGILVLSKLLIFEKSLTRISLVPLDRMRERTDLAVFKYDIKGKFPFRY